jgi:hypothetical protein
MGHGETIAMPKAPRGEKRSADVEVTRIATGEIEDNRKDTVALSPAAQLGKLGGRLERRVLQPGAERKLLGRVR